MPSSLPRRIVPEVACARDGATSEKLAVTVLPRSNDLIARRKNGGDGPHDTVGYTVHALPHYAGSMALRRGAVALTSQLPIQIHLVIAEFVSHWLVAAAPQTRLARFMPLALATLATRFRLSISGFLPYIGTVLEWAPAK
jgi:hypothetical protein